MQPLTFPSKSVILDFLKEDCSTKKIDLTILELVSEKLANQRYVRHNSLNTLDLKLDLLQSISLNVALDSFVRGVPPMRSHEDRIAKSLKNLKNFSESIIKRESPLDSIMAQHRLEKQLFEKNKDEAIQHAKENRFEDCIKTIKSTKEWQVKNDLCLAVAEFFAKQGKFDPVKAVIWEMRSPHSTIDELRCKNRAFAKAAQVFANFGFVEEACQSIQSIASDYSKYDDSEYATSEREDAWAELIEILIRQNKFKEANEWLWHVGNKDHDRFEKQIKKGLGT